MKRNKSILLHFYDREDLLHGIKVLQHYKIPICEVYTPGHIYGIESKLQIKKIRFGYTILKYGCLGGTALTTIGYYLFAQDSFNAKTVLFNLSVILVTFFFATRLFSGAAPKVIALKRKDNRYLMVVNANSIIPNDDVTSLFKYAEAVETSSAIKNMITA